VAFLSLLHNISLAILFPLPQVEGKALCQAQKGSKERRKGRQSSSGKKTMAKEEKRLFSSCEEEEENAFVSDEGVENGKL
jgi:hypothetical protein